MSNTNMIETNIIKEEYFCKEIRSLSKNKKWYKNKQIKILKMEKFTNPEFF